VIRRRSTIVLLLLGCRTAAPPEVAPPDAEPPRAEPPRAASSEPRREPETVMSAAPVPAPTAVAELALPFSDKAMYVAPLVDEQPVVMFPDETEAIRRRVVARLAALGREVISYEEITRIEKAALSGRLVLEDDRRCRAPLSLEEVRQRYFAAASTADPAAHCYEHDCKLQVVVEDPKAPDADVYLTSAKITRPFVPRAWVKAADSIDDRGLGIGGMYGTGFGASHPPPIMFGTPEPFGPWGKPPDGKELDTIGGDVNTCAHPDPLVGFTWMMRVALAKNGRVTRCDASAEHTQARTRDAECLCGFVEKLRYPAGRSGRRYRVQAMDDGGFRAEERSFRIVQAGTDAWAKRINEAPALDVCESKGIPPTAKGTTVVLDLQPDGTITGTQVHGDITTPEAITWANCLSAELPKIPLPCSPPGVEQLHLAFGPP
jgi:hypothetical protein